jgi:transposase
VHREERNGKACDDFELHVTFEWVMPKRQTERWMGVDRGVYNLAAYAVGDDDGTLITAGRISGRELRLVQRQEERRVQKAQYRG